MLISYLAHLRNFLKSFHLSQTSDSERGEVLEIVEYGFYDPYSECWLDGSAMEHRYQ